MTFNKLKSKIGQPNFESAEQKRKFVLFSIIRIRVILSPPHSKNPSKHWVFVFIPTSLRRNFATATMPCYCAFPSRDQLRCKIGSSSQVCTHSSVIEGMHRIILNVRLIAYFYCKNGHDAYIRFITFLY